MGWNVIDERGALALMELSATVRSERDNMVLESKWVVELAIQHNGWVWM